ncbi:MAG: Hpt domain-containing protein [Bacteroidota bacterium]
MIDRQQFNDMYSQLDRENVVELIDIFLAEYEEQCSRVRRHVEEKNLLLLRESAHKLKGALLLFMDPVSIQLSKRLVEMARNGSESGIADLYEELEKKIAILVEELMVIRKELIS